MPSIQEGLETPDVNTEEGFVAALAGKLDEKPEGLDEYLGSLRDTDTTVAAGLTTGKPEPQSAPEPVAAEDTTEEVPAGAASEEETPATDDAVAQYVSQHGGTPEQALVALLEEHRNLQQLDGRRSNELGDLRKQLQSLEERLSQPQQEERFDAPIPVSSANEELETFFEERGPQGAMSWIVENRPDLIEQAIGVWSEIDEVGATRFATRYDRYLDEETRGAPAAAPQEDPFLAQMKEQAAFTQAVEAARVASGLEGEAWESVKAEVVGVLGDPNTSVLIKDAVARPNSQEQRIEGMKALYQIAQAKALAKATEKATAAARETEQTTLAERKKSARVATGSLTPPQPKGQSEGTSEEEDSAERIRRFKENLLNAETTDVASGLSYNQGGQRQQGLPPLGS